MESIQPLGGGFTRRVLLALESSASGIPAVESRVSRRETARPRARRRLGLWRVALGVAFAAALLAATVLLRELFPGVSGTATQRLESGVALLGGPPGPSPWRVVFPGSEIEEGAHIMPFPGTAVTLRDPAGTRIEIDPLSEVRVDREAVWLLRGSARISALARDASIRVCLPDGVTIRGQRLALALHAPRSFGPRPSEGGQDDEAGARVAVLEGRATLRSGGREATLVPGEIAEVLAPGLLRIAPAGVHTRPEVPEELPESAEMPFDFARIHEGVSALDALRTLEDAGDSARASMALRTLGMLGHPEARSEALAALRDDEAPVELRIAAIDVLESLESTALAPILADEILADRRSPTPLRTRAVESLARASRDNEVARRAIEALLRSQEAGAPEVDGDPQPRTNPDRLAERAIRALAEDSHEERIVARSTLRRTDILDSIGARLLEEVKHYERKAYEVVPILDFALERGRSRDDLRLLLLDAPVSGGKATAATLLAMLGDRESAGVILEALRREIEVEASPAVSAFLVALDRLGVSNPTHEALAILARPAFHLPASRRFAVLALDGPQTDAEVEEALWRALDDTDGNVQAQALKVLLSPKRGEDAVRRARAGIAPYLSAFLSDPRSEPCARAVEVLEGILTTGSTPLSSEWENLVGEVLTVAETPARAATTRGVAIRVVRLLDREGRRQASLLRLAEDPEATVAREAVHGAAENAASHPERFLPDLAALAASTRGATTVAALEELCRLASDPRLENRARGSIRETLQARAPLLRADPRPEVRLALAGGLGRSMEPYGFDIPGFLRETARDPDTNVRLRALANLGERAPEESRALRIESYLEIIDEDSVPAALVVRAIEGIRACKGVERGDLGERVSAALERRIARQGNLDRRALWAAFAALRELGAPLGDGLLDACEGSSSWWLRTASAASRHLRGEPNGPELLDLLAAPTSKFRENVGEETRTRWTAALRDRESLAPVEVQRVLDALFEESSPPEELLFDEFVLDPGSRARLREEFEAFLAVRHRILDHLHGVLGSPDPSARIDGMDALACLGGEVARDAMLLMLRDPDPSVRRAALDRLQTRFGAPSDFGFRPDNPPDDPHNREPLGCWDQWRRSDIESGAFLFDRMTKRVRGSLAR